MNTQKISLPIEYWNIKDTEEVSFLDSRTIETKYFYDVRFTGHSIHYPQPLLYSRGRLLLPTIEKFMSLGRGTVYEKDMRYDGELYPYNEICGTPVFYFVYNMANYYHFIYDTLPYLYSYFYHRKYNRNLKLLVSPPDGQDDLYPFVWDCLELLGIKEEYKIRREDVVFLDRNTLYNVVLVGSSLTHNHQSNEPPHRGLFEVLGRMKGEYDGPEKVYVSRRTWLNDKSDNIGTNYTERRRCVNEDEMAEYFISLGFEEVFCENLTMSEKIGLFRGAKVVAGPSGGGMVNVLFSPPDTKVISIDSPTFYDVNSRWEYSLNHTNLHHFTDTMFIDRVEESVESKGSLSISGGLNSPWRVNMNSLKKFIDNIDG
tara:strand:+ start:2266 stop:3378 length:1113 start_codon:yes stop_codon:yes gene_type:complete